MFVFQWTTHTSPNKPDFHNPLTCSCGQPVWCKCTLRAMMYDDIKIAFEMLFFYGVLMPSVSEFVASSFGSDLLCWCEYTQAKPNNRTDPLFDWCVFTSGVNTDRPWSEPTVYLRLFWLHETLLLGVVVKMRLSVSLTKLLLHVLKLYWICPFLLSDAAATMLWVSFSLQQHFLTPFQN